jgi:hypothetical protein
MLAANSSWIGIEFLWAQPGSATSTTQTRGKGLKQDHHESQAITKV